MSRARFPRHVLEAGTEPDPRFTLANESARTDSAVFAHQPGPDGSLTEGGIPL
jgi:hypothetical protein